MCLLKQWKKQAKIVVSFVGCRGTTLMITTFVLPCWKLAPKSLCLVKGHLKAGGSGVVGLCGGWDKKQKKQSQVSYIKELGVGSGKGGKWDCHIIVKRKKFFRGN